MTLRDERDHSMHSMPNGPLLPGWFAPPAPKPHPCHPKPACQRENMKNTFRTRATILLLLALAAIAALVYAIFTATIEVRELPEGATGNGDLVVPRYLPDFGVVFEHSADFGRVRFALPEIPEKAEKALKAAGIDRTRQVGLVEKRFLEAYDHDWSAIPLGEVPAIVLEYHPAVPVTGTGEAGWLETCAASVPVQRIGQCDAYELPGYPGPCGEAAFCWLVRLPYGWLVLHAPRTFKTDGAPTGYDREIRRILETLTTDADAPAAP